MTNLKKCIFVIFVLLLSAGCQKEYEYSDAYIYKTNFVHWGRGLYKLYVSYEFEYNDSIYKDDNPTKGLYYPFSRKRYKEGDSILIQYPKGKPSKSEVVRLIYKKE
jgi:hypothetical protein